MAVSDVPTVVGAARNAIAQRLMDSLLHDVRNPLNALSINLDVLTEKIRRELGEIPAAQEKNLKVMREQIFRVDAIMKQFAEYLAPRPDPTPAAIDASEVIKTTLSVLGHECRRQMIKVRQMIEPDLKVHGAGSSVRFVVLQSLFRGVSRAGQEGELDVVFQREGDRALLRIKDSGKEPAEPFGDTARVAIEALTAELSGEVRINGPEVQIHLPLV